MNGVESRMTEKQKRGGLRAKSITGAKQQIYP